MGQSGFLGVLARAGLGVALWVGLAAGAAAQSRPIFSPDTALYTERALTTYQEIADAGGWKSLPRAAIGLKPGSTGPLVAALRERLAITSDLDPDIAAGDMFDAALRQALLRFQARHGLTQTGAIGPLTLAALNVPAEDRVRQLDATLTRLLNENFPFGQRYVVVNLPAASLEAVENGEVARSFTVATGRPDRPSPTLQTSITAVNILPYWHVPKSIARNDIFPKQARNPNYLAQERMRVLGPGGAEIDPTMIDWSTETGKDLLVRQEPGPGNSLGLMRIDMPNPYAVFMHGTPHQENFSRDIRSVSSGCVRVQDVEGLGSWLLEATQWTPEEIAAQIQSGEQKTVTLPHAVPVAWVYFTGWSNGDGTVQFRPDAYSLDNPMGILMSTLGPSFKRRAPKPAPAATETAAGDGDVTGSIPARRPARKH